MKLYEHSLFEGGRDGVFIDGPKGKMAQDNAEEHLDYSNVKVMGFHDRTDTEECDFHTFTLDFLQNYMYLNNKIFKQDPEQLDNGKLGWGCMIKIK